MIIFTFYFVQLIRANILMKQNPYLPTQDICTTFTFIPADKYAKIQLNNLICR